jgi:hypothetical protein
MSEVAGVWPASEDVPVWWDGVYKVFSTANSQATYRALFGSHKTLRAVVGRRSIAPSLAAIAAMASRKRWSGPHHIEAAIPGDAVLIPPVASTNGITVASRSAGLVLKINYDRAEIQREIEIQDIIRAAGIEQHVPELIDHGVLDDGGSWMVRRLAANTSPIDRPLNPFADSSATWRNWLRWKVLPCMERFYVASGLDILDVDVLLDDIESGLKQGHISRRLAGVVELAKEAGRSSGPREVVVALNHRDLGPGHIHRDGESWWILDWGSARRSIVARDAFRSFFWSSASGEEHRAYWAWLRGDATTECLPPDLRAHIDLYCDWYASWRGTAADGNSARCQLLIALVMDMNDVIGWCDLEHRSLADIETARDLPGWVRSWPAQLRGLNAQHQAIGPAVVASRLEPEGRLSHRCDSMEP